MITLIIVILEFYIFFFNTSFSNFSIINKHNRVKYVKDISYKVEFILLIHILRTQFCSFQLLKTNMFHIN